jgi:hypothetical protein
MRTLRTILAASVAAMMTISVAAADGGYTAEQIDQLKGLITQKIQDFPTETKIQCRSNYQIMSGVVPQSFCECLVKKGNDLFTHLLSSVDKMKPGDDTKKFSEIDQAVVDQFVGKIYVGDALNKVTMDCLRQAMNQ